MFNFSTDFTNFFTDTYQLTYKFILILPTFTVVNCYILLLFGNFYLQCCKNIVLTHFIDSS
jgi:hypothetical protein